MEIDSDYAKLKEQLETHEAELSLYEFLKQAWPHMEGDKKFIDGWHLQVICEHLEAVVNRQIKNLIINLPPRCCKSNLVAVAFPAWLWIRRPQESLMFATYVLEFAKRDSRKCRQLILSPWYQKRWGNRYKLRADQNTKSRFDNSKHGFRLAVSCGSGTTGEGASFLICDDPNNARDGESKTKRESTLDWWSQVWSTRSNDKETTCRIIIQQRLHEKDITGYVIDNDETGEWVKLILPMEYEEKRKAKTIILPSSNGMIWEDPRKIEGELLWPERFNEKAVNSLKNDLGSVYRIAGQLQQRPSPESGGIIKKDSFKWWKNTTPPEIEFVVQSWDTAYSKKETAAYSACTTWGVFYDHNRIENVILLSLWRGRVEYTELRERAKRLYFDYRDTGPTKLPAFTGRPIDMVLIEAKASGDPLIKDLHMGGIPSIAINPSQDGDKIKRVHFITPLIEGGRVWVPARGPKFDSLLPYADEFVELAAAFPNLESNDVIDTMSQALKKLKDGLLVLNPRDERPIPPVMIEPVEY